MELVYVKVFCQNMFALKHGISTTQSPSELILNRKIDFNAHCKVEYGEYVQTHEEHDNSMRTRTVGAIATRPTGNTQGGYYFIRLDTGRRINRRDWTALPMPNIVIDQVHRLARRAKANRALAFTNIRNEDLDVLYQHLPDDDQDDDDQDHNLGLPDHDQEPAGVGHGDNDDDDDSTYNPNNHNDVDEESHNDTNDDRSDSDNDDADNAGVEHDPTSNTGVEEDDPINNTGVDNDNDNNADNYAPDQDITAGVEPQQQQHIDITDQNDENAGVTHDDDDCDSTTTRSYQVPSGGVRMNLRNQPRRNYDMFNIQGETQPSNIVLLQFDDNMDMTLFVPRQI